MIIKSTKAIQRNLMIVVIVLLWFSNYLYVPVLSTYAVSAGASLSMVGIIIGSYGFTQMILRLPIGIISDILGNRRLFLFLGMVCAFISGLGFYFFSSPMLLLLFRAMSGIVVSNWAVYITSFASLEKAKNNSRAIGIVNSLSAVGQISGVFLGGVIAQYLSVKSTFMASALSGLLGIILLLFVDETYSTEDSSKKISVSDLIAVFKDSRLLFYSAIWALYQIICSSSLTGFVPNLLSNAGGNEFEKGLGTTFALFPMVFAAPLAVGIFKRRLGSFWTGIISFIILSVPMFFFPFIKNIPILLALQFIAGIGKGLIMPLLMSSSTSHLPEETRSTALSVYQAVYSIGMSVGPAITGVISNLFSLEVAFVWLGLTGLLAIFLLILNNLTLVKKAAI